MDSCLPSLPAGASFSLHSRSGGRYARRCLCASGFVYADPRLSRLAEWSRDIGHFDAPRMVALLRVATPEQLERVVAANAEAATAARGAPVALYPVSTGRNWGLGSRIPITDGCAVLDLSGMNRIRSIDMRLGVAVVEPGVTLAQLHDALEATRKPGDGAVPFFVNTTASCAHTSVLGNAMDRGVGFERQRAEDLVGLEVVTATGKRVRMGSFWNVTDKPTFHFRHGVGPNLLQTFVQSNFGVATAAAIALVPTPELRELVVIDFGRDNLGPAMTVLSGIYRDKLMTTVAKIYNESALSNYGVDTSVDAAGMRDGGGAFKLLGSIQSTADVLPSMRVAIQDRIVRSGAFIGVEFHSAEDLAAPGADTGNVEAFGRFCGKPTCEGHRRAFGPSCDLDMLADSSDQGWIFFVPIVPFTAEDIENAVDILGSVARDTGLHERIGATLNILGPTCVDLVTTIHFDNTPEGRVAAHRGLDLLHDRCRAAGYFSYREDVRHMDLFGSPEYRDTLSRIKKALDPLAMFAPGRYVPDDGGAAGAGSGAGGDLDLDDPDQLPQSYEAWQEAAGRVLHPVLYDYYKYTAGHASSVGTTRKLLNSLRLRKRCLTGLGDAGSVDTSTSIFGSKLAAPILIAPTAMHGMLHKTAELGTARGAAAAGCGYVVNALLSNTPLDDIQRESAAVAASPDGGGSNGMAANWMHVYIYKERELTERVVRRAEELGFSAIVVTADHPTERITEVFVPRFFKHAEELPDMLLPNLDPEWRPGADLPSHNDGSLTWSDVTWLTSLTSLPVIVKGVTCVADAALAYKAGARGVVVSNHGGRQLDGGVPALEALPAIARTFRGRLAIILDSGIRTGGDVLRALALGADAVFIGRPVLWGLTVAGHKGVTSVLNTMADELRSDMAHCGASKATEIGPHLLEPTAGTRLASKL